MLYQFLFIFGQHVFVVVDEGDQSLGLLVSEVDAARPSLRHVAKS